MQESKSVTMKESESVTGKKSSISSSLVKFRSLLNLSLKIRKGEKVPKPLKRLEESIVDDNDLGKGSSIAKLKQQSNQQYSKKSLDKDSILPLDRTQSDVTLQEIQEEKQIPKLSHSPLIPTESINLLADEPTQKKEFINYDPKILELKVKRRIRLYAKISFWMTFIVLSTTFIIFIIAIFGWWITFSAYGMLRTEQLIRFANGWKNKTYGIGSKFWQQCNNYRKISTLPWSSWTECFRSTIQSVQWRWRNLSSGLYFIDQQLINVRWC